MVWIFNITAATESKTLAMDSGGQLKLGKLSKSNLNLIFERKRETCQSVSHKMCEAMSSWSQII